MIITKSSQVACNATQWIIFFICPLIIHWVLLPAPQLRLFVFSTITVRHHTYQQFYQVLFPTRGRPQWTVWETSWNCLGNPPPTPQQIIYFLHDSFLPYCQMISTAVVETQQQEHVFSERDNLSQCTHQFVIRSQSEWDLGAPPGCTSTCWWRDHTFLPWLCRLCSGVNGKGFVYRDLKLENLLLGNNIVTFRISVLNLLLYLCCLQSALNTQSQESQSYNQWSQQKYHNKSLRQDKLKEFTSDDFRSGNTWWIIW